MIRTLKTILGLVIFIWALFTALIALFLRQWLKERHGRGGPIPASQAGMLLHPLRSRMQSPESALRAFQVSEGDTVLELGPGPGYFSVEASRIVGAGGRVVCLDVQPHMIAILNKRLHAQGALNARPVVGDATRLPLADRSIDKAFLVAVLGEIPDRPAALGELRRVLKPGGILGFSETLTDPDYQLRSSLDDLCRAFGFERLQQGSYPLGYTASFAAPNDETPG